MATSKKQKRDKSAFEDPTYDHNFKLLFGEPNKHLLISFLNSILIDEGEDIIQDISYVSPEYSVNAGKLLVLPAISDLRVVTESNQDIIIEMQRDNKKGFLERAQYYMGRAISMKLKPGDGNMYDTMRQTIILVIARKNLFGPNDAQSYPDYISTVVPYMLERKQELDNRIMLWKFVEIDRFLDFTRDDDPSAFDLRKQWIHFLGTCADNDEVPEDVDAAIKEAYAQMTVIDEMMQKAQDQVDDSIRLAECIRKEGEVIHIYIDCFQIFSNIYH